MGLGQLCKSGGLSSPNVSNHHICNLPISVTPGVKKSMQPCLWEGKSRSTGLQDPLSSSTNSCFITSLCSKGTVSGFYHVFRGFEGHDSSHFLRYTGCVVLFFATLRHLCRLTHHWGELTGLTLPRRGTLGMPWPITTPAKWGGVTKLPTLLQVY